MPERKIKTFTALDGQVKQMKRKLHDFVKQNNIVVKHIDTSIDQLEDGTIAKATVIYIENAEVTEKGAERLLKELNNFDKIMSAL